MYSVKVLDSAVRHIETNYSRIFVEGVEDTAIHCWVQGNSDMDKSDPNVFFYGREQKLTLDGFPTSTHCDESGTECIAVASSGTIWYVNWLESGGSTIKIKSCHSPKHEL